MKNAYSCAKYTIWMIFTLISSLFGGRVLKLTSKTEETQFSIRNNYDSATDCATAYFDKGLEYYLLKKGIYDGNADETLIIRTFGSA
ncbi:unnamed protein product [Lupinus luteus]|uniref:Uncharacterized protein n=1 Tax=Lupinus luteus TaxID=3873 RepID=A0AAV1X298_LUPLU